MIVPSKCQPAAPSCRKHSAVRPRVAHQDRAQQLDQFQEVNEASLIQIKKLTSILVWTQEIANEDQVSGVNPPHQDQLLISP